MYSQKEVIIALGEAVNMLILERNEVNLETINKALIHKANTGDTWSELAQNFIEHAKQHDEMHSNGAYTPDYGVSISDMQQKFNKRGTQSINMEV